MTTNYHQPVMVKEVMDYLDPRPGQTVVDATLGGGGHAAQIASRLGAAGLLVGIDQDPEAISAGQSRLETEAGGARCAVARVRFDRLSDALDSLSIPRIDAILFDLGVSSHQLDEPSRGFSFKDPAMPLDMRMDPESGQATASDLLNSLDEAEMTRVFRDYADEKWAARIAQFIVERRKNEPYDAAGQLIETVKAAIPAAARAKEIHPATRVFQALRIAVNEEFSVLESGLEQAVSRLREGAHARIAVISYHSGEDRIVKRLFARRSGHCECPPTQPRCICGAQHPILAVLTKRPLVAGSDEVARNPRARSAKMRVAERL